MFSQNRYQLNHFHYFIPQCSPHSLIVHVWLVLVEPPQSGHGLAVHQLEDALLPVTPLDELRAAVFVLNISQVMHLQTFIFRDLPATASEEIPTSM